MSGGESLQRLGGTIIEQARQVERMRRIAIVIVYTIILGACAQERPSPEKVAAQQSADQAREDLIAAECKLYKGTNVTPPECKAPAKK